MAPLERLACAQEQQQPLEFPSPAAQFPGAKYNFSLCPFLGHWRCLALALGELLLSVVFELVASHTAGQAFSQVLSLL